MAHPVAPPGRPLTHPNLLHLVRLSPKNALIALTDISLIPESPRFLVSRDRREEAFQILVRYHAEGNPSSPFVHAEMAQIESTIRIELANSKRSWLEMLSTSGMRKRVLVGSFLGLFTQWSGNTLITYYMNDLLELSGFHDPNVKGKINIGLSAWNLVNAVLISLLVRRFPRRKMYLTCATALLCCYVGWTVSMQQFLEHRGAVAAKITIFFIFAYSPCYNIGYNALTYSKLNSFLREGLCFLLEPCTNFVIQRFLWNFSPSPSAQRVSRYFNSSAGERDSLRHL